MYDFRLTHPKNHKGKFSLFCASYASVISKMFAGPTFIVYTIVGFTLTSQTENQFINKQTDVHDRFDDKEQFGSSSTSHSSTTLIEPIAPTTNIEQKCPKGFSYYKHFLLDKPYCYFLTEPQTFPPACPYQNYLEFDAIRQISEQFHNQSIWIKAKRDTVNGFGQFEWLYASHRYLDMVKEYSNPRDNILQRNCLIREAKTGKFVPMFCDQKFPTLCVYSYSQKVIGKYCSKRNKFAQCISTTLDLDNKCFCQAHVAGMQAPRAAFCQKLAEPIDPFQNHMLLNELTNKSPCWFGLERNNQGEFHWASQNHSLDYTYWKETPNEAKPYAALDYTKPKGWILEDDYAFQCAICEIEVPYQNVTIRLVHIPKKHQIELRIQNFFDIQTYDILRYVLVCFTDSNIDGLTYKKLNLVYDIISIERENYTTSINVDNYYPSYFWCETFQRPNLTSVLSNTILVYQDIGKHGHEYAFTVTVPVKSGTDPYLQDLHVKVAKYINDSFSDEANFTNVVRPMRVLVLSQEDQHMILLLHMSVGKNNLTSLEEHTKILKSLQGLTKQFLSPISEILNLSRSEVCLPNITTSGHQELNWPETPIGTTTIPRELCVRKDSTPVTRRCEGDFLFGAFWGEVQGECSPNITFSDRTITLYDLLNSNQTSEELAQNLCDVTESPEDVLIIDVHFIAEILEKLAGFADGNVSQIAYTLSNVMEFDPNVLNESQMILNSTDKILGAFDKISPMIGLDKNSDHRVIKSASLFIQVSEINSSNVTGLLVEEILPGYFNAKPLYSNTSIEELWQDELLDVAILLPPEHIAEIKSCMEGIAEIKLVIAYFAKNALFNEVIRNNHQDNSRIVSVLIPGSFCEFENPLVMIFRPLNESGTNLNCGFWRYGNDEKQESLHGSWETDSDPDISYNATTYAICKLYHTTHYALLMFNDNYWEDISEEDVLALNIITAVGCALSLLGLSGIFITAIAFKSWRNRARNIIMLNFSFALAAQMILLFITDNIRENSHLCPISGASLHYTVLSVFAWMLVVAILQYRKFVVVFQKTIRFLIFKCLIVGWFLPLVPVLIQFLVFPVSYEPNAFGLCYPDGKYFYYGVALPVSIIVVINLFVFIKILCNICRRKVQAYGSKDNDMKLQVLLAILLFFLLGMSWIFGLAAAFLGWLIFSYLFCLTATIQGFVIFVFFVVMNEKSRLLWLNIKKLCFCTEIRKQIY